MRLKRLEMQGYKSFAAPTAFLFDANLTAVVGPNGSGKSNIADAIRWVLGEQSYSSLRGKRTEDMIFSGSTQRARLGMAQAIITLDNEDHELPIDYNEVTIERRAYRSGENEYRINGNRVRLRDINDLLSAAGLSKRTYAVIGQGLVDAALSLRPEERRTLFEEAAGITSYQTKRAEAVNRLKETSQNIIRVNDIINEIRPQLRRLERQAEQAREYQRIDAELHDLLLEWYGFRWHQAQEAQSDAIAAARNLEQSVANRRRDLDTLEQRITASRASQQSLRQKLGEWHRESSRLHAESEAIQRNLAIRQERGRQIELQREELKREIIPLRANREGQAGRLDEADLERERLEQQMLEQEVQSREMESQMATIHEHRRALVAGLTDSQNKVFHVSTRIADHENRILQINERRQTIAGEEQEHRQSIQQHSQERDNLNSQLGEIRKSLETVDRQAETLLTRQAELQQATTRSREEQTGIRARIDKVQGELNQLQVRHEGLSRLRDEMTDYYQGVRAVLGSQTKTEFPGLLGTVAGLLEVSPDLERAIEVALGNHIQDVVAENWGAAQRAIEYLKKHQAGRATFLPLDSLRPTPPVTAPGLPGVIGLGLDLVSFDEQLRPVFELLLGHTIIVQDLNVAHRVFKDMRGGFQIVTSDGEIVRSSGAISGGSTQKRQSGLLARERELRELPGQISEVSGRRKVLETQEGDLAKTIEEAQLQMQELEEQAKQLRDERTGLAGRQASVQQAMAQAMREIEWRQTLVSRLNDDRAGLDAKERELRQEQDALQVEMSQATSLAKQITVQITELDEDPIQDQMSNIRTQMALTQRAIESQQIILENHTRALQDLERQVVGKEKRVVELEVVMESLARELEQLSSQGDRLSAEIAEIAALTRPAEQELAEIEKFLDDIGREETSLRNRLRTQESLHSQAYLEVQRRRDELDNMRRQIEEDLGFLVETDPVSDVETQQPLPLRPIVERLSMVTQISPNLKDEIRRLKAQKQRLGNVNPNALEEYNEVEDRHVFLTEQAADLQEAATSLQAVIAELDELIARDFTRTFRAIASEFKEYFAVLFGGGTAKLILTEPDDPLNSGIEIIAKPPGKRQQSLNLLSGGERALTAAALIFGILRISPTPFCVLDEVDAMLDEANVGRFRDTLQSLAHKTQFIIITHNRRTIEVAQTIYGISMGEDNTSVIVSLKLDGDESASVETPNPVPEAADYS